MEICPQTEAFHDIQWSQNTHFKQQKCPEYNHVNFLKISEV